MIQQPLRQPFGPSARNVQRPEALQRRRLFRGLSRHLVELWIYGRVLSSCQFDTSAVGSMASMLTGAGIFNKDTDPQNLNFINPPRRDVTFLPGRGWVVIAFPTDNPGAWLMHCHIAWHISQGLGVQFLEAKDQIRLPGPAWHDTCSRWKDYYNDSPAYHKEDSGL